MNEANSKKKFEDKIKPLLSYIGFAGATLMCIAYIIIVLVLINGFNAKKDIKEVSVFAIINAVFGFIIMQFLKFQGQTLAKDIEDNKVIYNKYYDTKTKDKKLHSLKFFWITSVIKDLLIKCVFVAASSLCVVYIVVAASKDYHLLALAFVNLIMFICFGLLSLVKAYDYYNDIYIPYLKEQIQTSTDKKSEEDNVC